MPDRWKDGHATDINLSFTLSQTQADKVGIAGIIFNQQNLLGGIAHVFS
jgi:hypothetical protein